MLSFHTLLTSFRSLGLSKSPVIAHASLSAFGPIRGGAETLVGAMLEAFSGVLMPTFTYATMVTPEVGPPGNGIRYGSEEERNKRAEFYRPDIPADARMGIVPETLRRHPKAKRSLHPIYSFSGVNSDEALRTQSIENPFGPIQVLADTGGWVLLLGVDHTVNTSIHYAEQLSGRKQFIRWALTPQGVVECPRWPGCSYGFNQISPRLKKFINNIEVGQALVQAIPLKAMIHVVKQMIAENPFALLCSDLGCERCQEIRRSQDNG